MKFQPKSEIDLQNDNLWPVGVYGFEVLEDVTLGQNHYQTIDRVSKNGNEMIQLVLKVYNDDGRFITVIDYLLESIAYKLRHAAAACGLLDKYETGILTAADFKGKSGNLKLKIDKDKTGQYSDRNGVADYVTPEDYVSASPKNRINGVVGAKSSAAADMISDDIPF